MALISNLKTPDDQTFDIRATAIPFGQVDSSSTATVFTATVPGITQLVNGTTVMLQNGVVTSASGFTLNVNGLGAKPCYTNLAAATRDTTIFNVAYTMLFVYDEDRVSGGAWICYRGYDANTNTIGYQLRSNSSTLPTTDKFYRYRILFTSADGTHWVPSTTSTSTNATAARAVNQRPIDPFGEIVYYGTTTAIEANANVTAAQLWQQYTMTFGYAFNRTGAALVLTYPAPIYIKCAPQSNGSAIIDADTPYVQSLPTTEDGKIYIFLGRAYSATAVELLMDHPVYYYKDGAIRLWTNAAASGSSVDPATATPLMDGTGAVGTSAKYAREDHVHPNDTTKLEKSHTDEANFIGSIGWDYSGLKINTENDYGQARLEHLSTQHEVFVENEYGASSSLQITSSMAKLNYYDNSRAVTVGVDAGEATLSYDRNGSGGSITIDETGTAIHNVITPTSNGDAANKQYVDNAVSGISVPTKTSDLTNDSGFITSSGAPVQSVNGQTGAVSITIPTVPSASTTNPSMDGTASYGSGTTWARADHVHPTDTSRQATLVSGTNIKTVNGNSLLGSGDLAISGLPTVTASDNGKVLMVVNGAWAAADLPVYDGSVLPSARGVDF